MPDQMLIGTDGPQLLTSPAVAALIRGAVAARVEELRRQGASAAIGVLEPWSRRCWWLATQQPDSFPPEPAGSIRPADPATSTVTTSEAATMIGCTRQWVTRLIARGELEASRAGHIWLVETASIAAYRTRR